MLVVMGLFGIIMAGGIRFGVEKGSCGVIRA